MKEIVLKFMDDGEFCVMVFVAIFAAVVMFIAYEIGSVEKSGMEIAVNAGLQQCYEPNNRTALWKRECNVQ